MATGDILDVIDIFEGLNVGPDRLRKLVDADDAEALVTDGQLAF